MLRSLAYIYFFPFVLFGYFLYLCVVAIRGLNRWMAARAPQDHGDLTLIGQQAKAAAGVPPARSTPEPPKGKATAEISRFLSRPFRSFTILWGVLLLVTTHPAVVWLCLIVLLLQLARKIFFIGKVLLFSDPWLKKYGPLLFAGLNKTLQALDAVTPDADPGDKEMKSLLGQLNLWRRILAFLKNPYLLSRWAWVIAVGLFISIYTYFSILFSFGYYGIARVSGVNFPWPEALTTSMFLPFFATDLPNVFSVRVLGGIQGTLIVVVGIGTVMNFLRRKLESVRRAATAFSDRLDDQAARDKYLILEAKFSPVPAFPGGATGNDEGSGPADDEDNRFSEELLKLRQQIAAARSSEGTSVQPMNCQSGTGSTMEPGHPALALFELGEKHEMRIEWPEALDAYRSAWKIEKNPKYGIKYASVAQALNRVQEAESTYEEVLGLQVDLSGRTGVLSNLGLLYKGSNGASKAEQAYVEALTIRRKLAETAPEEYSPAVAETLNGLAILYHVTRRDLLAEEALCEALAIYRKFSGPRAQYLLPKLAATVDNLGLLYGYTDRSANAEECFREALEIRRNLADTNPFLYLPDLANTLTNLGIHCLGMKQRTDAQRMFEEALAIRRALADAIPESYLPEKAASLQNLGTLYAEVGRSARAEQLYVEALAIYRKLAEVEPDQYLPDVAARLNSLGELYGDSRRVDQAEEAFGEALEIRRRLSATDPETRLPEVVETLVGLAGLYLSANRMRMAMAQASEAERLLDPHWRANPVPNGDQMARVLATHAQICQSMASSSAEATTLAERALEAAQDPALKEKIRLLIESLRSEQTP
jgi:tetratricopeptide (TPR) repeat protein